MASSPYALSTSCMTHIYANFTSRIIIMITISLVILDLCGLEILSKIRKNTILCCIVCIVLVLCSLIVFIDRNYYLPFLGWSVYPCGSLTEKVPTKADTQLTVQVKPNSNVIFWASEPSNPESQPISNPWDAYANYENAGVVKSDARGIATLKVRSPSTYRVGLTNRKLENHIHYRVCENSGMLGPVQTLFL